MRSEAAERHLQPSLDSLVREAFRVARGMASLRDECVGRLSRSPVPQGVRVDPKEGQTPREGNRGLGFSPFYSYPFLFATLFPAVTVEDLRRLSMANRLLLEAILLADKKIDETRSWTAWDFCQVDRYVHKALEMLIPLFPPEHEFWQKTREWYLQHARAILDEQLRHRHSLRPYTHEEFFEISIGKVALLKSNLLAMGTIARRTDVLNPLMKSQDQFLAGFQCFDDLRDWKEDLRHGNYTFLLTRVLFAGGFDRSLDRGDSIPREAVGRILYHRGFAEDQLRLAERHFQKAMDAAKSIQAPLWTSTVEGFMRHCQTLRHDLAEIRRRTRSKMRSKSTAACLQEALHYLLRSARPSAGFPLAQSPYPFMNPPVPLASSRFVTFCVCAALAPLQEMYAGLSGLLLEASQWLARSPGEPRDPSLPVALEASFVPVRLNKESAWMWDRAPDGPFPPDPRGLPLAHLLFTASRMGIRLPRLESWVADTIRKGEYASWAHAPSPDSQRPPPSPDVCHPLVSLLLICHACGPDLPRQALHDYLLRRSRAVGTGNHPTETALNLLCLMASGYQGPELSVGVERLVRTQEEDGSWPPNALYEERNLFYGSRQLTTAWCLLALFLHHLAPPPAALRKTPSEASTRRVEVLVNTGSRAGIRRTALSAVDELRKVLPSPWPHSLYIGHWPDMPPHFFLKIAGRMVAGINLLPRPKHPVLSTGRRPLSVEIALALMSTHRCMAYGPLRDRLERVFVSGLALSTCAALFPDHEPWERLGMPKLQWAWCREHEAFLWEELRRFLLHPCPKGPVFRWLLPDPPSSPPSPIPKGAALFLAQGLFAGSRDPHSHSLQLTDLLGKSLAEILRAFRRKVGLENSENVSPWMSP